MNDIQGYRNGPVESGASRAKEMSPRAYNLAMSALIFLGFNMRKPLSIGVFVRARF